MKKLAYLLLAVLFAAATVSLPLVGSDVYAAQHEKAKSDKGAKSDKAAKGDKSDKSAKADKGDKDKKKVKKASKSKKAKGSGKAKDKGGNCGQFKYYDKKAKKCVDARDKR